MPVMLLVQLASKTVSLLRSQTTTQVAHVTVLVGQSMGLSPNVHQYPVPNLGQQRINARHRV